MSDEQRRKIKVENESESFKIEKVSRSFGKEMQQARCAKKFTQKTLAQRLNVKSTIIANYEQGKAIPNNALINKKERKTIEFENISEIEEIADKLIGLDPIRDMLARNPFVKKKLNRVNGNYF